MEEETDCETLLVTGSRFDDIAGSADTDVAVACEVLDDTIVVRDLLDECADDAAAANDVRCDEVDDTLVLSMLDAEATAVSADPDDKVEADESATLAAGAGGVTCCEVCTDGEQSINVIINTKQPATA